MSRVNLTYGHTARPEPITLHDGNIVVVYNDANNESDTYLVIPDSTDSNLCHFFNLGIGGIYSQKCFCKESTYRTLCSYFRDYAEEYHIEIYTDYTIDINLKRSVI